MNFSSPGLYWPSPPVPSIGGSGLSMGTAQTLNAAGLKLAFIGRAFIYGRPTAAKTLSSAGGLIGFRSGAVTFSSGTTSIDIGIQGVSTSAGPAAQPDAAFGAKLTSTTAANKILATTFNNFPVGTGSSSITHGDLIAVVFDMTARGGTDSIIIQALGSAAGGSFPVTTTHNGTSWLTTGTAFLPNILITFDDGTLATIDGGIVISTATTESFASATNPNERGILFQVPADCYVDAFWAYLTVADASAGLTFGLYANPISGQSSLTTLAFDQHMAGNGGSQRLVLATLPPSQIQLLRANSEYGVSILATGTSNVSMQLGTVGAAGQLALWPGGTTTSGSVGGRSLPTKITRNGSSGNFSYGGSLVTYLMGVRIASFLYANTLVNGTGLVS